MVCKTQNLKRLDQNKFHCILKITASKSIMNHIHVTVADNTFMEVLFKKYIPLIILALLPTLIMAQRKNPARAADDLYNRHQYYVAIDKYRKAYLKIKNNRKEKNRINYRLADCYRLTENYRRAEMTYKRLIRAGWDKKYPEILLHLADMQKINGHYDEALQNYQAYSEKVPDDPRGRLGAKTIPLIQKWIENPSKYEITNVKKINSRDADFAPAFLSNNYNELVFTSTREIANKKNKGIDKWTGQHFSNLFVSRQDRNGEWSTPKPIDASGNINTKANEGAAQTDSQFKNLYFTRCKRTPNVASECQLFVSRRIGRSWGEARPVKINTVDTTQTIGQPTLSPDGLMLIFSSDRKGGQGGKDLWAAIRKSKNAAFSRPVNLGKIINTKGNEMFPFLHGDTALYFSSDGHGGMGGLDIFVSKIDSSGSWGKPQNLKYPINSPFDDFGIVLHPTKNFGYLSSNRKGGRGKEDIYYFIQPPLEFSLSGTVTNERTLFAISNIQIKLIGSDGSSVSTRTNNKGFYSFGKSQIKPQTDYEIKVSKEGYFNATGKISTKGIELGKDFKKDFVLKPISSEPIVLPDILYDLGKWDLKPQYQDSLQGLVQTLRENPNLVIELASHTDSRDTEERNDILSQKRARSVVDYLIMRGIDAARLVPKGYGERVPRTLKKDIIKDGFLFKKGTTLDDNYINSLSSKAEKEAAYSLNRRSEFRVLRKNYVPKSLVMATADTNIRIAINPQENAAVYHPDKISGLYVTGCVINGYHEEFTYDKKQFGIISLKKAMEMLQNGVISKDDFAGNPEEILKNNTIANRAVINLMNVRIANKTVQNIQIMVDYQLNRGLVFGDRILSKFGKYHFNTQKKLLILDEK